MGIRSYQGISPQLGARVFVDESALVIGRVNIAQDSSIWPFAVARGDVNFIRIGARTNIQDGAVLHVVHEAERTGGGIPLIIGDDVTVGHQAMLHAVSIGNRCLIGMSSVLLDGAIVEDDVIVGAGAVVPPGKRLSSGGLYIGNPVRRLRDLTAKDLQGLLYSAGHYVDVKELHRADQVLRDKASRTV